MAETAVHCTRGRTWVRRTGPRGRAPDLTDPRAGRQGEGRPIRYAGYDVRAWLNGLGYDDLLRERLPVRAPLLGNPAEVVVAAVRPLVARSCGARGWSPALMLEPTGADLGTGRTGRAVGEAVDLVLAGGGDRAGRHRAGGQRPRPRSLPGSLLVAWRELGDRRLGRHRRAERTHARRVKVRTARARRQQLDGEPFGSGRWPDPGALVVRVAW